MMVIEALRIEGLQSYVQMAQRQIFHVYSGTCDYNETERQ